MRRGSGGFSAAERERREAELFFADLVGIPAHRRHPPLVQRADRMSTGAVVGPAVGPGGFAPRVRPVAPAEAAVEGHEWESECGCGGATREREAALDELASADAAPRVALPAFEAGWDEDDEEGGPLHRPGVSESAGPPTAYPADDDDEESAFSPSVTPLEAKAPAPLVYAPDDEEDDRPTEEPEEGPEDDDEPADAFAYECEPDDVVDAGDVEAGDVERAAEADEAADLGAAEAVTHAHHCFELTEFVSMDVTADGSFTSSAPATATTPPEFTVSASTRFRTVAGLDTHLTSDLRATPNPTEFLSFTLGRVLLGTGHLRVDPADATLFQVRLRGVLCHPSRPGHPDRLPEGARRCPVVIIVHGNHASIDFDLAPSARPRTPATVTTSTGPVAATLIPADATLRHEVPSYRGYRDLQEHLATLGIVSVSIDTNAANLLDSLIRFRADLVLEMLDHLRVLDATSGSALHDRLDFSRVALVGHSRGGDAVAMAADLNSRRPTMTRYGMRAVVVLSPTDFTGLLTPESERVTMTNCITDSFLSVYGAHDGDVSGAFDPADRSQGWSFVGTAFRHYDRATTQRAMVFIHGATHNRFNSVWIDPAAHAAGSLERTLAESQADNFADEPTVDPRKPPSTAFPTPAGHRDARVLSAAAHRTLAREYIGGWLSLWLQHRWGEVRRFTGAVANSLAAPVALQWKVGRRLRTVDDFDDSNPARNVVGGSVTLPTFVRERLIELTDPPQSPHHDRTLDAGLPAGATRVYRTALPPSARDWTRFSALSFRVSKRFPNVSTPGAIAAAAFPPAFELTLFDGTRRRSIDAAAILALNPRTVRPYHRRMGGDNLTKVHLQTWQVPLSSFAGSPGVSLSSIHAVELAFNAAAGEPIHFDTLSLVQTEDRP